MEQRVASLLMQSFAWNSNPDYDSSSNDDSGSNLSGRTTLFFFFLVVVERFVDGFCGRSKSDRLFKIASFSQ